MSVPASSLLLLELVARSTYVDAVYYYRPSSMVCRLVGRSVTLVNPSKTAELIEMPFGLRTRVGSGNHAGLFDGIQVPHGKSNFEGERGVPL